MNEIEKQAAFYRGFLTDDRNPAAVAVFLIITVVFWLLIYAAGGVRAEEGWRAAELPVHASYVASGPAGP